MKVPPARRVRRLESRALHAGNLFIAALVLGRSTGLCADPPAAAAHPGAVDPTPSPAPPAVASGPITGATFVNSIGIRMVRIPAGTFSMGSPLDEKHRFGDEIQHPVTIRREFFLGSCEVTVKQFRQFVEASRYRSEAEKSPRGAWAIESSSSRSISSPAVSWQNPGFLQLGDHPVTCVSWNDARAFCEWLSARESRRYRLPTEAEWEYSCRAGTTAPISIGPGSALSSDRANFDGTHPYGKAPAGPFQGRTVPVGGYPSNSWGIHDMIGNVNEWCADWYGEYPGAAVTDPVGPTEAEARSAGAPRRTLRGSSWFNIGSAGRSARRGSQPPEVSTSTVGFRVVLELTQ